MEAPLRAFPLLRCVTSTLYSITSLAGFVLHDRPLQMNTSTPGEHLCFRTASSLLLYCQISASVQHVLHHGSFPTTTTNALTPGETIRSCCIISVRVLHTSHCVFSRQVLHTCLSATAYCLVACRIETRSKEIYMVGKGVYTW